MAEPVSADRQYREDLNRRLSVLPRRALTWLALAPEWPQELVSMQYPGISPGEMLAGDRAVELLQAATVSTRVVSPAPGRVSSAAASGPARRPLPAVRCTNAPSPWNGVTFRIAPELRGAALEDLLLEKDPETGSPRPEAGLDYIRGELKTAGETMLRADKLQAYPTLWRWAQLASRAESDAKMREFLEKRVQEAIDAATASGDDTAPEALRWLEAAESFTEVFQGKLELTLTLARRRRELFNRRAYDRRKLANYLRRDDQLLAFRDLLDDPEHWALHYAGGGGLGKTMLLRYITHFWAEDELCTRPIVTSRVDFDFLNPDYPFKSPGLLLTALASELRLQAGADVTSTFEAFDSGINRLNDEATSQAGEMRLVPLDHKVFAEVIDAFAKACNVLGQTDATTGQPRRVVLMLDTCEELAKLRPDGTVPANVQVTFEVLKAVRAKAENVRVVFSGRRALASKGFGWVSDAELPERGFLRLFVVKGFTEKEAQGFLEQYDFMKPGYLLRVAPTGSAKEKPVPETFRGRILDFTRSTAAEQDDRFRPVPSPTLAGADPEYRGPRHNPYDLDMYAEWSATDSDLTIDKLQDAGPHFYVEERILRRLNRDVRRLLPQLALLGRFGRRLLEAMTGEGPEATLLRQEVISQEWLRADRATPGDNWLIESRLSKRILAYYRERASGELEAARQTLAATLQDLTLHRPFGELAEQNFDAAFEAMQGDPEAAALWWMQVEERIALGNEWINWAQPLTMYLLAQPVLSSDARSSFRAAVLATQASALLRTPGSDVRSVWQRAEGALPAYPAQTGRARLEFRIQCGVQTQFRQIPQIGALLTDEQCRASWLAAAEALVDRAELEPTQQGKYNHLDPDWLHRDDEPHINAFARCLSARLEMARKGDLKRASSLFESALHIAGMLSARQAWLDWRAPDSLVSRIQLEFLRISPEYAKDITSQLATRGLGRTIDDDRMFSALLREMEIESPLLEPAPVTESPRCNAHRQFPPLAVTLCEKKARVQPTDQIVLLRRHSEAAKNAGLLDISLEADRAITRVICRQRLGSENYVIPPAVTDSAAAYDVWLAAITRAQHLSGTPLEKLAPAIPEYDLPETHPGSWLDAEYLLLRLERATLSEGEIAEALEKTVKAFEEIHDPYGTLICSLIEATWRARRGKSLNEIVERLQTHLIPDTSWAAILHAAEEDDPSFLDALRPDWRPWITRALAVCARAKRRRKSNHPRRIAAWLKANCATEVEGQKLLPYELAFIERTPGVADLLGKIFGFTIVIAILAGLVFLFLRALWGFTESDFFRRAYRVDLKGVATIAGAGAALQSIAIWILHGGLVLVIAFLGLVALGGVGAFFDWLGKRIRALSWIDSPMAVDYRMQADSSADPNRPMAAPWTLRSRPRFYYVPLGEAHTALLPATTEERYRFLRATIAPDSVKSMEAVYRMYAVLKLVADVHITVDPGSAGGPWEAYVGMGHPEEAQFQAVPCRFSRTVSGRTVSAQPDWPGRMTITTWMYSGLGIDRASITWRQTSGARSRNLATEVLRRPSDYEQVRHETGVAQIFGWPVERASDVFLRVGGVDRDEASYLVSPTDIQRRYPNIRLLIVQAPPENVTERSSTDRLQAAQLKRFGALAFQSGIPAVLVLPALPPALVDNVMSQVFNLLTRNTRNASRGLVRLTRALQELVGAHPHPSPDVPLEMAFDICLYVENRVNFRSRTTSD